MGKNSRKIFIKEMSFKIFSKESCVGNSALDTLTIHLPGRTQSMWVVWTPPPPFVWIICYGVLFLTVSILVPRDGVRFGTKEMSLPVTERLDLSFLRFG